MRATISVIDIEPGGHFIDHDPVAFAAGKVGAGYEFEDVTHLPVEGVHVDDVIVQFGRFVIEHGDLVTDKRNAGIFYRG